MKSVCYTAIIGNYDYLKEPLVVSRDWDYICFTDRSDLQSNVWKIVEIDNPLNLDNIRLARSLKILGHELLREYGQILWIDGNVRIKSLPEKFISDHQFNADIMLAWHHGRNCIYDEAIACIKNNKDDSKVIESHMQRYREQNFPTNFGLVQTGIIVRKNNNKTWNFCKNWWSELMTGSRRDQLSFDYVLWKNKDIKIQTIHPKIFQSEYFQLFNHTPFKIKLKKRRRLSKSSHNEIMKNRKI